MQIFWGEICEGRAKYVGFNNGIFNGRKTLVCQLWNLGLYLHPRYLLSSRVINWISIDQIGPKPFLLYKALFEPKPPEMQGDLLELFHKS